MVRVRMVGGGPVHLMKTNLRSGCRHASRWAAAAVVWAAIAVCLGSTAAAQELDAQSRGGGASQASDAPAQAAKPNAIPAADVDVARARSEALARLKSIAPQAGGELSGPNGAMAAGRAGRKADSAAAGAPLAAVSAADKPLHDLLQERLRWLDEYDKLSLALAAAANPDPNPDSQTEEARTEFHQLQKTLADAASSPEILLAPSFRAAPAKASSKVSSDMKDAVESTAEELKEWRAKLDSTKTESAKLESIQSAQRLERDRLFQKVATLKARTQENEAAVTDAQTAAARRLAAERLANFKWETKVESLRLRMVEAQIALEVKLARLREMTVHVQHAHVVITEKTLELMRARYRVAAENYERDLNSAAAKEETKARRSQDPLERFRAWRTAELLVLESQVLKGEQALATSPRPSLDEQRNLADRAEADFARIKELLDDGNVSRLDAIRLNNEFRRIGPERDRLLKNEMAMIEAQLQFYEDALTSVELELVKGSLHDQFEHDLVQERLPEERWAEGEALLTELEQRHHSLLSRRRTALEKLTDRASHTLQQVSRRLSILDEEYGFIRTTIFWVRDQDPIGMGTLAQTARELNYLLRGSFRLAAEAVKPALWGQPSAEFLVAILGVLAFPFAFLRLRRLLAARIDRALPLSGT
jgi:hypothetical protein